MQKHRLVLYSNAGCPFCHRVLRVLDELNMDIEIRQTSIPEHRQNLIAGGGKAMVPCLLIEEPNREQWLYESLDIIEFLRQSVN